MYVYIYMYMYIESGSFLVFTLQLDYYKTDTHTLISIYFYPDILIYIDIYKYMITLQSL